MTAPENQNGPRGLLEGSPKRTSRRAPRGPNHQNPLGFAWSSERPVPPKRPSKRSRGPKEGPKRYPEPPAPRHCRPDILTPCPKTASHMSSPPEMPTRCSPELPPRYLHSLAEHFHNPCVPDPPALCQTAASPANAVPPQPCQQNSQSRPTLNPGTNQPTHRNPELRVNHSKGRRMWRKPLESSPSATTRT